MRLDHLLAADALGAPLDDARREKAVSVLSAFGFQRDGEVYSLDDTFPWVTVEDQDGLWRVHVESQLPAHLIEPVGAVLEGLLQEAVLVRLDPFTRREISALEWSRRFVEATGVSAEGDSMNEMALNFEGKRVEAQQRDTVASALLRAGVTVFSRGPKYHRPRGPFCLAGICSQCHMRVDGEPDVTTCTTSVRDGMTVERQNVIGSGDTDLLRAVDFLYPSGIDHHHLMTKSRLLNAATKAIARRLAGIGELPERAVLPVPARTTQQDLVIIGGGSAGLAVAKGAVAAGLNPLVLEERGEIETAVVGRIELETAVVGLYAEGGKHLVVARTRHGLWQIEAERVVLATGAHERNVLFESNDLPAVFGGRALLRLVQQGVHPGASVAVVGSHADAVSVARGLYEAGIEVVGLLDAGTDLRGGGDWPLFKETVPVRALGRSKVLGLRARPAMGEEIELSCDLIAVVAPRVPAYELAAEVGARSIYSASGGGFVVVCDANGRTNIDWLFVAGAVADGSASGEHVGKALAQ